jgi:hypothetical protein
VNLFPSVERGWLAGWPFSLAQKFGREQAKLEPGPGGKK